MLRFLGILLGLAFVVVAAILLACTHGSPLSALRFRPICKSLRATYCSCNARFGGS